MAHNPSSSNIAADDAKATGERAVDPIAAIAAAPAEDSALEGKSLLLYIVLDYTFYREVEIAVRVRHRVRG